MMPTSSSSLVARCAFLVAGVTLACSSSGGSSDGGNGNNGGGGNQAMGGNASSGSSGGSSVASASGGQAGASGPGTNAPAMGGKSGGGAAASGGMLTGGSSGTGGASSGGTLAGGHSAGGTSGASGGSSVAGGAGSSGAGGTPTTGGTSGGAPGIDGGSGAAVPSAGCGKTSTLTFGSVPNESASAAAGSGNGAGFGQGGYVTLNDSKAGGSRGFALRLPQNYDNTHPYWLIFDFHWNGGDAAQCDNGGTSGYEFAYYGLQPKSNEGAIFVGPDSIGSGWSNSNDQDLYFTDDMVKLISDNYCVDMSNLITTGFSWGGGMSYELACARANAADDGVGYAFRAAVIFEGAQLSGCDNGKEPIALWQMVGLTDTTCPVNLATPIRDQFVKSNGCTGWTSETGDTATASTSGSTSAEPPRPGNPPPT